MLPFTLKLQWIKMSPSNSIFLKWTMITVDVQAFLTEPTHDFLCFVVQY